MKLREAQPSDQAPIWEIIQQGIAQRRLAGSEQWQNGYPNSQTIANDIAKGYGYVLVDNTKIIAYSAVIFDGDSAYAEIKGAWLSKGNYVVLHRIAVSDSVKGQGIAAVLLNNIEKLCIEKQVFSIKADTNFDNLPMLKVFAKQGYVYCGEVIVNGGLRQGYEKLLSKMK